MTANTATNPDNASHAARPVVAEAAAAEGYWQRTRALGFALPRCAACGKFHFYPRRDCPSCGSDQVAPATASGRGTIYSYSVVYRAPSPAFAAQVPYVIAIVATDEGPHLMTRIIGMAPDAVRVGQRVQVSATPSGLAGDAPLFEPVD